MTKGKPTDPSIRVEIVNKIRNDGLSVSEASATYGISSKSIYYWLREGVVDGNRNLILENNRLKKGSPQAKVHSKKQLSWFRQAWEQLHTAVTAHLWLLT